MRTTALVFLAMALATGCGSNSSGGGGGPLHDAAADGSGDAALEAATDAGSDAESDAADAGDAGGCHRTPGPADAVRKVVVSHPFDASGNKADTYEVLDLSASGELSRPGTSFQLGRSTLGEIAFTPDGKVGLVAEEDGKLGVFRFDANGAPQVVDAAFDGGFYAGSVVVDPGGDVAYVLDDEWRNNGGGIYAVPLGCDGTPGTPHLVAAAKLPAGLAFLPGDPSRALLASKDVLSVPEGNGAHLLSWGDPPSVLGSAAPFPDTGAIVSSAVVTHDAKFALIGDNDITSSANRIGVVGLAPMAALQVLSPIEDPLDFAVSPYDNAALVVSGFGNAIFKLAYDPSNGAAPFSLGSELAYQGGKPQLPGYAVSIDRGALTGLVLVAENTAVRRVRFEKDGSITDLGAFSVGSGTTADVGAIGVQP
jgi:hypothetical protein